LLRRTDANCNNLLIGSIGVPQLGVGILAMRTFCGALVEFERQEVAINLVTALFLVIGVLGF
jgi:hypothetical protein